MKFRLIANAFYRQLRRNQNINHRATANVVRKIDYNLVVYSRNNFVFHLKARQYVFT